MKVSFQDHFESVEGALKPQLLNDECASSLAELCSFFPLDITSDFGFESRLGTTEPSCDFFLRIIKNSAGANMIAGKSKVAGLSHRLLSEPMWPKIVNLFGEWTTPGTLLAVEVDEFWLEFDYLNESFNITPNIFIKFAVNDETTREIQSKSRLALLDEIYNILFDIPFPSSLAANLRLCIESLPERASLSYLGFMLPRQTEVIRVNIDGLDSGKLQEYLDEIKWPGEFGDVTRMFGAYTSHFFGFVFNINIGESILPYLGIEMFFPDLLQPQFDDRWDCVFDILESENLLTPEKRVALTGFCGVRKVYSVFPISYFKLINHLKLVYKQDLPAECKCYFGSLIR